MADLHDEAEPKKRGAKPKAPEDKVVRKNVSVDEESLTLLNEFQGELETELGFKPTLSQCLKHLIVTHRRSRGEHG